MRPAADPGTYLPARLSGEPQHGTVDERLVPVRDLEQRDRQRIAGADHRTGEGERRPRARTDRDRPSQAGIAGGGHGGRPIVPKRICERLNLGAGHSLERVPAALDLRQTPVVVELGEVRMGHRVGSDFPSCGGEGAYLVLVEHFGGGPRRDPGAGTADESDRHIQSRRDLVPPEDRQGGRVVVAEPVVERHHRIPGWRVAAVELVDKVGKRRELEPAAEQQLELGNELIGGDQQAEKAVSGRGGGDAVIPQDHRAPQRHSPQRRNPQSIAATERAPDPRVHSPTYELRVRP